MAATMPSSGYSLNKVLFLLILMLFNFCFFSQRIVNLSLGTSAGIVRVDFTIGKGFDCYGYRVWHSSDSVFFNQVEDYPGLCSSSSQDMSYNFNHNSPALNAVNYYKVELSNVETSPIQRIYVPANDRPLLRAYPNPVLLGEYSIQLKTSNTENGQLEGFLCDESGHKLQELFLNCVNYNAELPLGTLGSGIYFLWLSDGYYVYGSKFVVSP